MYIVPLQGYYSEALRIPGIFIANFVAQNTQPMVKAENVANNSIVREMQCSKLSTDLNRS